MKHYPEKRSNDRRGTMRVRYLNEEHHIASARVRGEVKLINWFSFWLHFTKITVKEGLSFTTLGCKLGYILKSWTHFEKMYKRAAGRFTLLKRIRPLIDKTSVEKIYKAMIQPVLSIVDWTLGLCWSRYRQSRIESIERRSQKVIGGNYQVQTVGGLIKRQPCQLVFDCAQDHVCTPFKGYFTKIERNINTRN